MVILIAFGMVILIMFSIALIAYSIIIFVQTHKETKEDKETQGETQKERIRRICDEGHEKAMAYMVEYAVQKSIKGERWTEEDQQYLENVKYRPRE